MKGKTEYLQVRINPILKERVREQAEREGKGISEYITDLIKIDLAKKGAL